MEAISDLQALLFDFDGVILETEVPGFIGWQKLYAEYGQTITLEEYAVVIGSQYGKFDPRRALEERIGRTLDWETLDRQRRDYYHEVLTQRTAMPGIKELVEDAHGRDLKLAIVSSSPREWVDRWLRHVALDHLFDSITTIDDVSHAKPSPELYLCGLSRFGLTVQEAMAIEDSPNGAKAAYLAGLFCVIVPNEITRLLQFDLDFPRLNSLANIRVKDLEELRKSYFLKRV
ncbi:MAG: HAD family phosphatase [Verrucomicrobiota bacterium]